MKHLACSFTCTKKIKKAIDAEFRGKAPNCAVIVYGVEEQAVAVAVQSLTNSNTLDTVLMSMPDYISNLLKHEMLC